MSFRTGEREDSSKYKYPIRPRLEKYTPQDLEVIRTEHKVPEDMNLMEEGFRIYETGFQKDLPESEGSFVDYSIVDFISRINRAGYETIASCSGMERDHIINYKTGENVYTSNYAYLSIELPENVAQHGSVGEVFDVPSETIHDIEYINKILGAAYRAGWKADLSRYLFLIPTVRLELPKTHNIASDEDLFNESEYEKAQKKIDDIMKKDEEAMRGRGTSSSAKTFLDAIEERDEIRQRLYKLYDVRRWSDSEILEAWDRLVTELEVAAKND